MGSWSNSLHVRADDATVVANAIERLLTAKGRRLEPTPVKTGGRSGPWIDDEDEFEDDDFAADADDNGDEYDELDEGGFDDEDLDGGDGGPRGIRIFKPVNGWVGVLDSDLEGISELAGELSLRLSTDTMLVLVNDSDSWYYWLHRNGVPVDEFDSMGSDELDDELPPAMREAMERGDDEAFSREAVKLVKQNMPKGPIFFPFGETSLPPELAELHDRVQKKQAGFWERMRYRWRVLKFLWQLVRNRNQAYPIQMGFDIPRQTPLDAEMLDRHIRAVLAFFPRRPAEAPRPAAAIAIPVGGSIDRVSQDRGPAVDVRAPQLFIYGGLRAPGARSERNRAGGRSAIRRISVGCVQRQQRTDMPLELDRADAPICNCSDGAAARRGQTGQNAQGRLSHPTASPSPCRRPTDCRRGRIPCLGWCRAA